MILMWRYKKRLKKLNEYYFRQLSELLYWNKVEKTFARNRRKHVEVFDFKFNCGPGSCFDDENLISGVANLYGYYIVAVTVGPDYVYTFAKHQVER